MFGYVSASFQELTELQRSRYGGVYCGICRALGKQSSAVTRLGLSYDMAFLVLLLMSLYEPEEMRGRLHCALHPLRKWDWVANEYVSYAADMNAVLAYYKFLDDKNDDGKLSAGLMAGLFSASVPEIEERYPRQCRAIRDCIAHLSALEAAACPNPDEPAGVFGELMAELLVYRQDLWEDSLRQMGMALGRFVYLADAAVDYAKDAKKGKYNPFLAQGSGEDWPRWEEYLVLTMGRCTDYYERLPLVQDKDILDNILYSGVWTGLRGKGRKTEEQA